MIDIPAVQAPE